MKYLQSVIFTVCLALFGLPEAFADRQLSYSINPDCPLPQCNNGSIILIHVKAIGDKDTLHHIWDFSGKPSVVLARTAPNASLIVTWSDFALGKPNSVQIIPQPMYTYGVVLDEIIEFNDEKDIATLDLNLVNSRNASYITTLDMKNFDWKMKAKHNDTGKVLVVLEGRNYNDSVIKKNGTVQVELCAFAGTDHGDMLPRLLHSGNASQIDIILDKLSTQYPSSRFGIHLITASNDNVNATVKVNGRRTLDDEHAPGVFNGIHQIWTGKNWEITGNFKIVYEWPPCDVVYLQEFYYILDEYPSSEIIFTDGSKLDNKIVEMLTPGAVGEDTLGGYLQWRPVVYTSSQRDMTNSTTSMQYTAVNIQDSNKALNLTMLYSLFGFKLAEMLVVETNVTFGESGDGFYHKTNYAVWTLLAGYGHPPIEKFSMLVTLVLSIGLGLPALLILVGVACMFVRRLTRNKDDLFLSR